MKRYTVILLAIILLAGTLFGCGQATKPEEAGDNPKKSDKINVVCTIFPQYDWVRQILGGKADDIELTLLLDGKADLHNYQPSVDDIVKISECDLFIYVGGESDAWVDGALAQAVNPDMVVVNLLEALGDAAKEEQFLEGMEDGHDHGHEELDPNDVKDRLLSDWLGSWTTIENALANGGLDEYIAHQAEENKTDAEAQKAAMAQRWKSDYKTLEITEQGISFDGVSANYKPMGYKIVESDHGASVWYGFQAEAAAEGVPSYIAFSDHGTGAGEEVHEEHADELPHYHLRYGSESFDALIAMENWAPTFFPSDAPGEAVSEAMSGHGHAEEEYDEHVWLSLKNAKPLCEALAKALARLVPENAEAYQANLDAYQTKLSALEVQYQSTLGAARVKTLLFGDRFPFRYLVDDYGITYDAAFPGCSAETEASFDTVARLAKHLDEWGLHTVMVTESADQSIARTIIGSTKAKNQQILVLDSMQSVTFSDSASKTYLSIMESNLSILRDALK